MKNKIPLLLAVLLFWQPPKARPSIVHAGYCVAIGIAVGVAYGIKIFAERCETKTYCVRSKESGEQWCRYLTKGRAAELGTNVLHGPFESMPLCNIGCSQMPTNVVQFQEFSPSFSSDTGDDLPPRVTLERSVDLVHWETLGTYDLDVMSDAPQLLWESPTLDFSSAHFRFSHEL